MKRYKVNYKIAVNTDYSEKGFIWEYRGKISDLEAYVKRHEENEDRWVKEIPRYKRQIIRITDTVTGQIVYEG